MKETFYFTHDYNARSDEKIKKLIRIHWMQGYWLFWSIIEDLYQNANALRLDYDGIAFDMRVEESMAKSIIHDFDLFIIEWDIFGSKSVETRLLERDSKSSKARDSARKRWEKNDANAMRTQSECNAIKEKKEKEKKEYKENNTETVSIETEQAPIDSKEIVIKKEYGNEDINKMLLLLKNTVWCDDFSESKDWQRKYWKHFLTLWKNIWNDEFSLRLEWILSDWFKAKNCNSLKYLYNQMKSYIHSPIISNTPRVW